jgi:hypothetical protein
MLMGQLLVFPEGAYFTEYRRSLRFAPPILICTEGRVGGEM